MSILIYVFLIIILRVAGKRILSQYNMFDVIISVAYGSSIATALISKSISFTEGALVLLMLTLLQFSVALFERKSPKFYSIISAKPVYLYYDGEYCEDAMRKERVVKSDVRQSVRQNGKGSMEDIEAVILEGDGKISVISKSDAGSKDAMQDVKQPK
ncbi:hypothetical protein B0X71_07030 [Planococcus lenghuensis]|uniref:YetF C-terminal domain-containing protein n=2 Tax=Planococcus lenghuensis TaxID=2213202 RepID=A0A1Q2L3M4_9BACL|nr:hypothetical protein B0X71_07030 [Planococcus lenghuensis]